MPSDKRNEVTKLVDKLVANHKRWGKLDKPSPSDIKKLLGLLSEMEYGIVSKAELNESRRQTTAAVAREEKYKKEIEELKAQLAETTHHRRTRS